MNEEVTTMVIYQKEKCILEQEEQTMKLEIPEWNFERLIKTGSVNQIDKLFATYIPGNKNNVVIAGHNIHVVFRELHNIHLGMKIYLKKGNKITEYVVIEKKSVKPTEIQYLEDTIKEQLTLITCTENDQKRLIIICLKQNIS
ncbi:MAG: sortase [Bacilli bacterium]|nr:sortase [Bacilli bacterium]